MNLMNDAKQQAFVLALIMTTCFVGTVVASAVIPEYKVDPGLIEAEKTLVALTWGYYFGSSTGSKAKDEKPPAPAAPEKEKF